MRPVRLGIFLASLIVVLGLALWLAIALQQLYTQIALLSPWLANAVVGGLVLAIGGLMGSLVYYGWRFTRPKRSRSRRPPIELPAAKKAVAATHLQAIEQQIELIEDEVARQALLKRSQILSTHLSRQKLQVVIFGRGSTGKTALVNALLGQPVGTVAPAIGTTTIGTAYQVQLRGLAPTLLVIDTPGLAEIGSTGQQRDKLARKLALGADLLIFVIDNDLQRSEYELLQALHTIGKRCLLVLNKGDCYSEADQTAILTDLRERLQDIIAPENIVVTAAHPQVVNLVGTWVQPEPDIQPLVRRMVTVLRSEGEDLVADNILLQTQRLSTAARYQLDQQRQQQAEKIVERYQWIGAGVVAVNPLPLVDLLGTAAINAQMVVELGRVYDCELNLSQGKQLARSLAKTLGSLGLIKGTVSLLSTAIEFQIGTAVVSRAIQSVSAAYLTAIAGKSFMEYFRRNQNWGDGGISAVVEEQFRLNRRDEFVKQFIQSAFAHLDVERTFSPQPKPQRGENDSPDEYRD
jgi:hypothetical protein